MPTLIRELASAARENLRHRNWYGALALALSLPDQCSFLETGIRQSQGRYVHWFDKWVGSKYVHLIGPDFAPIKAVFLCGNDMYALRCAFLHQGSGDLDGHSARKFLSKVQFVFPDIGSDAVLHQLRENDALYLQVDRLTQDICDGVDAWISEHHAQLVRNRHALELAIFRPVSSFSIRGENNLGSRSFRNHAEAEENGVYFPANWAFFSDESAS